MGKDPCQEKWGVSAGYCAQQDMKRHEKLETSAQKNEKGFKILKVCFIQT